MVYDAIVVGGGPAGATAARLLGQSGVSTLLIDKSSFPRDKPCGGGISARVLNRFPYLRDALRGIPVHYVSKVYFESPAGIALDYASPDPLYLMVRRVDFDQLLHTLARPRVDSVTALVRKITFSDSEVRVEAEADASGESRTYRAKMILGCDGANSVAARAAGLRSGNVRHQYAIDMMEETPYESLDISDRDRMYVYYGFEGNFGYSYVFPKTSHVNLGLGCKLDFYLASHRGEHYPRHRAFVDRLISNRLLAGSSRRDCFRAFPLPISGPLPRTFADRVLLAGDAGGFVNAFTAEGIYFAMVSGDHAARAAVAALRAGDFSVAQLSAYQRNWKTEIGGDLSTSLAVQRLLISDLSRVDRLVTRAQHRSSFADLLARYTTGALSLAQFKKSVLLRELPFYLAEKLRGGMWPAAR